MRGKSGEGRKSIGGGIAKVTLSAVFVLLLTIGFAGIVIYKSGEMSIKASVSTQAPQMKIDEEEVKRIRESLEYNKSIAWQEGWIAYEGKVYEYREDMLNFLLLGIDQEGELSKETQRSAWAGCADAIFLVSLHQDDKTISVIGIPRNSMVQVEVFDSEEKNIDTVYDEICLQYPWAGGGALGLETMKESVSGLFEELPIHGVCAISGAAVSEVVALLGGMEVVVPDDVMIYGDIYAKGSIQTLTRKNVLAYLKYRDQYALGAPTVRLTRQKEFMKIAAKRIMDKIVANPAFISDVYETIEPYMNTDITLDKAVYTAAKAMECRLSEQSFYQLTGEDKADYIEGTDDYYNEYYLDEDELKRIMIEVFYKEVQVFG